MALYFGKYLPFVILCDLARLIVTDLVCNVTVSTIGTIPNCSLQNQSNGESSNLRFKVVKEDYYVGVDPYHGRLYVKENRHLDMQSRSVIELKVKITDLVSKSDEYADVVINIVDDGKPIFNNSPYPFQAVLNPQASSNELVYILSTVDGDGTDDVVYNLVLDYNSEGLFQVDPFQGYVRTTRAAAGSYPLGEHFILRVNARNSSGSEEQVTPLETVSIMVGPRPPQFAQVEYITRVYENISYGVVVETIMAKSFTKNKILYSMNSDGSFEIPDANSGNVVLQMSDLNYSDPDQKKTFGYKVAAIEQVPGSEQSETELILQVTDVNNHDPHFVMNPFVEFDVDEKAEVNVTPIATVLATDLDDGLNAEILYKSNDNRFTIDENGVVRNLVRLDYSQSPYRISVVAQDRKGQVPYREDVSTLILYIKNKNTRAPEFINSPYNATVAENARPGSLVTAVNAIDHDNDGITYSIVTNPGQIFQIDSKTGVITTVRLIDSDFYEIEVSAQDDSACCDYEPPFHTSLALVYVIVYTVENIEPYFPECDNYSETAVYEGDATPVNTPILNITAKDKETGKVSDVTYKVENPANLFHVNEDTGEIKNIQSFDRLQQDEIYVTVTAKTKVPDGSTALPLVATCTFKVTILDINNHNPTFQLTDYRKALPSDISINSVCINILAVDYDEGENGTVDYTFDGGDDQYFTIHTTEIAGLSYGEIRVKSTPDPPPETVQEHSVKVNAKDNGASPREGTVVVYFQFYNPSYASPPVWINIPNSPIDVKENDRNINIVSLTVDPGNDGVGSEDPVMISFDFNMKGNTPNTNANGEFSYTAGNTQIQNSMNITLQGSLDYNVVNEYMLPVRVQQRSANGAQLYTDESVLVDVEDMNMNKPEFTASLYTTSVKDNDTIGTHFFQVSATDKDGTYPNNKVTYSIDLVNDYTVFGIDKDNGSLFIKETIDSNKAEYYITVRAEDGASSDIDSGDAPNSATATVNIVVMDSRVNIPKFQQSTYSANVSESLSVGSNVFTLSAEDNSYFTILHYYIVDGNELGSFGIGQMTGEVYVQKQLDYQIKNFYNVTAAITDGSQSSTCQLQITLRIENLRPPSFTENEYNISTPERNTNAPINIFKAHGNFADPDSPDDAFQFELSGQGSLPADDPAFSIDKQTGDITMNKPLIRDPPYGQEVYNLLVSVMDSVGNTGYTKVIVILEDENNYPPYWLDVGLDGLIHGYILEGEFPQTAVMLATATDYDKKGTPGGTIVYEMEHSDEFSIDADTGEVKSAREFDREQEDTYYIKINARDQGTPPLIGEQQEVVIHIVDKNDNSPKFNESSYDVTVDEGLPEYSFLLRMDAYDEDVGDNAKLEFSIVNNDIVEMFHLVSDPKTGTGILQAKEELDYENPQHRVIEFDVSVTDGHPNHVDSTKVVLRLNNLPDTPPTFEDDNKSVSLREKDALTDTTVTQFIAHSQESDFQEFTYAVDYSWDSDPYQRFRIDNSGFVILNEDLIRNDQEWYNVRIFAIMTFDPAVRSEAMLNLELVEPYPRFAEDYDIRVDDQTPAGSQLLPVACAMDTPEVSPPFSFTKTLNFPYEDDFEINKVVSDCPGNTGVQLLTKRTMDRQHDKSFKVPIEICDRDQICDVDLLTVTVNDDNDNLHKPGTKSISVFNYKNSIPDNTEIGTVYAEDVDDWDVGDKTFTIQDPQPEYFLVDENSGAVLIKGRTPAGEYSFKVVVYDAKHNAEVVSTVNVDVQSIWDDAVFNSGSVRIRDMTAKQFIDTGTESQKVESKLESFKKQIAATANVNVEKVLIFSVMDREDRDPPEIDVRYAASGSPYYPAEKLDGAVANNLAEIESATDMNIVLVPVDECIEEICQGAPGCRTVLTTSLNPTYINTNTTSLLAVTTITESDCVCDMKDGSVLENCNSPYAACLNGGTCTNTASGVKCNCLEGFLGPRCQLTTRSFTSVGWAWFEPLQQCEESRLTFEFITQSPNGLFLYNGPIREPYPTEPKDYIGVELVSGQPRLLINHGTGTLELTVKSQNLADGMWHQIDIIADRKEITLVIDRCKNLNMQTESGNLDESSCKASGYTPGDNSFLNVVTPLQLGGMSNAEINYLELSFRDGFDGCIKNVNQDGRLYDLGNPGLSEGSSAGCSQTDASCDANSIPPLCINGECNGYMDGSVGKCECFSGWQGDRCDEIIAEHYWSDESYLHYQFTDEIELRPDWTELFVSFRTVILEGVIFIAKGTDIYLNEYVLLRIRNKLVEFGCDLGSGPRWVELPSFVPNDGEWHTAHVERFGSDIFLKIDGGGRGKQGELIGQPNDFRLIDIDKDDVIAGAEIDQYQRVVSDFIGCINDIRYSQVHLPLSGNNDYAFSTSYNVEDDCTDDTDWCFAVECDPPFICVSLWYHAECQCPDGYEPNEANDDCLDINECLGLINPCLNNGICENIEGNFTCHCFNDYSGIYCEIGSGITEPVVTLSAGALAALIICLLLLLLLIIVFIVFRVRKTEEKYPAEFSSEDDIKENIIHYHDEGGGEEDHDGYDITFLRKPVDPNMSSSLEEPPYAYRQAEPRQLRMPPVKPDNVDVGDFINERLDDADNDPEFGPPDGVLNYNYEGEGSSVGSLSSLGSSDGDDLNFDYLDDWGPRFQKLANLYGGGGDDDSTDMSRSSYS